MKSKLLLGSILTLLGLNSILTLSYVHSSLQETKTLIKQVQVQQKETQAKLNQELNEVRNRLVNLEVKVNHCETKPKPSVLNKLESFIKGVNPSLPSNQINLIAKSLVESSKEFNVPLSILIAVAWQESHFNPYACSSYGCIGIMQVNPKVWSEALNIPESLLIYPDVNIRVGAYILRYYYNQTGSWRKAIRRYYGISPYAKIYHEKVSEKISLVKSKVL